MRLFSNSVLTLSTLAALSCGFVTDAKASVFFWQSEDKKVSVTFQDTWGRVSNQKPSDLLTVKAPGSLEYAMCTISQREDERFKIYPNQYAPHIQKLNFSKDMWTLHFDGQKNPVIHEVRDAAQLSVGYASMASASYETAVGPKMRKRAIGFASLYRNKLYTVECSAEESVYDEWHGAFMSFMKAVEFNVETNHALSGYYRDFIDDTKLWVKGPTVTEDTYR
ncbi:MAG: hypothetical protein CBB87_11355 [Micavibrio sp. TMED27]|nr:hypothetical protein [Micavibrio sp.]OUT89890.1 MAG: hypothetical protein CBB87_11355 [Micavibrio sp. TMED27]|tara:strand:+ start:2338 stop:3003 length:666 start_codon:yes stop_codon:yes gene_type:complete